MKTMMNTPRAIASLGISCLLLVACGKQTDEAGAGNDDNSAATNVASAVPALPKTASPEGARVFFVSPENGAVLSSPIKIEFGIDGMTVVKAGDNQPNSGHHHLLINTDLPNPDFPIPADASHVHFGDGSTATEISLEPGEYSLQMLLGDHLHIPHNPPVVSQPITITVE